MTMEAINRARQTFEDATGFTDFVKFAALKMSATGVGEAERRAQELRLSERIQRVLKAAVPGGLTSNAGLAAYGPLVGSFMDSLRNVGAFDRLLRDAFAMPLRPGRVVVNSSAIVASEGTEAVAKPIKALHLTAADFSPRKVIAQIVMSKELIDGLGDEGLRALGREMRASVALGTDTVFLAELATSNSFEGSSSNSFADMMDQLEELAHQVQLGVTSKPYFLITSSNAKALAKAATVNGITTMGMLGGELMGVPIVVTDGQAASKITLVDASGLAITSDPIDLRSSEHASIEMSDTPSHRSDTPTAAQSVSMWQTNNRCLLCERSFAVKVIRPSAVATLTNAQWGAVGDSPAGF